MTRRLVPLLAVAAALLAGCGSDAPITGGGRVVGDAVTVYSALPDPGSGVARDMVDAQKLALLQRNGRAGGLEVNFVSLNEAPSPARAAEAAIRDPQVMAFIGGLRSEDVMIEMPLLNAAGILQVSPGAGYAGFTEPAAPGEPDRWLPSGRQTFARVIGDDAQQAGALLAAARAATRDRQTGPSNASDGPPRARAAEMRVAVEAEGGRFAEALAGELRRAADAGDRTHGDAADAGGDVDPLPIRFVADPARADAVIYAGTDLESAMGVLEALAREAPRAALVVPDELTRAGIGERLPPAVRRRAVLVSSAPEPGSTPALRDFETAFEARFRRRPNPYAVLAHDAMRRVLEAMDRAGSRSNLRRRVIDAWFDLPPYPNGFTARRGREYLQGISG